MRKLIQATLFLLLPCFLLLPRLVQAQGFQYEEGTHYAVLEVPVRTRNPEVVEVTEYFSYGCTHCYQFESVLQLWKKRLPEGVEFNRSPAIWQSSSYQLYARTYYTILALGVQESVHLPLFQGIHVENRSLGTLGEMTNFMKELGVNPSDFVKTFNDSLGVKAQYQQAIARQRLYRARSVPTLIVNGKYRVNATMTSNSNVGMLQVASFLVEKELQSLKSGKNGSADTN